MNLLLGTQIIKKTISLLFIIDSMDYVTWGCQRYRNESNMKVKGNIITARAYT